MFVHGLRLTVHVMSVEGLNSMNMRGARDTDNHTGPSLGQSHSTIQSGYAFSGRCNCYTTPSPCCKGQQHKRSLTLRVLPGQ